jgi:hypothetical protein
MINVTDGPNVHVRLTALEFLLGHSVRSSLSQGCKPACCRQVQTLKP